MGLMWPHPGAQEYYDSVIEYLAENGIDFIKADDIVEYPLEIAAVAKAVGKVARPMVISLWPGNETFTGNWDVYGVGATWCALPVISGISPNACRRPLIDGSTGRISAAKNAGSIWI